ncbi:hypothetical protein ABPG74_002826 [Tetrahymena malaccensis]
MNEEQKLQKEANVVIMNKKGKATEKRGLKIQKKKRKEDKEFENQFNMGFGQVFGKLAEKCSRNKCIAIGFCILVTGVFAIGILNLRMETDPQNLWAPNSGRTFEEQKYFNENFGQFFRINQIIMSAGSNFKQPGGTQSSNRLLQQSECAEKQKDPLFLTQKREFVSASNSTFAPRVLAESDDDNNQTDTNTTDTNSTTPVPNLFQLDTLKWLYYLEKVINTRSFKKEGLDVTVDNLCYKPVSNKGCLITSPMDYWKMNITLLNERAEQLGVPKSQRMDPRKALQYDALCIDSNTKTTLIPCTDSNGIPIIQQAVIGGSSCEQYPNDDLPCQHCWIQSQALVVTYLLNKDSFTQQIAETWEKDIFEDTIFQFRNKTLDFSQYLDEPIEVDYKNVDSWPDLDVQFMAERSIPDELVEETSQNIWVVALSYSLMFIYISLAIGSFPSKTHSGFLIGLAGIFIVIFSIVCSIGFMSFIGIGMTMISGEVIPFLILAIGVDNMFIISTAVKGCHGANLLEKIKGGMTEVGPSITAAAVSEILAFMVGTFTNIPALTTFCIQAAIAVFFDYIFQITAFVAILAWDEERKLKGICDVFVCIRTEPSEPREDLVKKCISKFYIPVLKNKIFHMFNFLIFAGLVTISIIGLLNLNIGLNQQVSLITGSDLNNYFDSYNKYIEIGPLAYLVLENVDYRSNTDVNYINRISNALSLLNTTVQPPVYSWIATFNQFANPKQMWAIDCNTRDIDQYPFEVQVQKFMNVKISSVCCQKYGICGEQFNKDIIFNTDGTIKTSRLRFQHRPVITSKDFIDTFEQTRQAVDKASQFTGDKKAFSYSLIYAYYDQYTQIRAIAVQNFLLAVGAVYLAINLLKNGMTAIIVALNVFFITFNLIGIVWVLNSLISGFQIEINAVSVVNLITSVGLGVEFCVHLVISYMNTPGNREQKVVNAVKQMGSNILVGIASTKFIGVIVLGFASSEMFRIYYFRMYMAIIFLGVFQGLMFLPSVLYYIGPVTKGRTTESFIHKSDISEGSQEEEEVFETTEVVNGPTKKQLSDNVTITKRSNRVENNN